MAGEGIVVGVDGSPSSVEALRWALGQASLTGDAVEAVCAWSQKYSYGGFPIAAMEDWEKGAETALDNVLSSFPADQVERVGRRVVRGHPVTVLLECAADARLLVVGSRGHGGFTGMLLGSVSQHVASHAGCPVVIVRPPAETDA
jgi:nucleotide-binding universal stress UspA family protein